MNRQELQESKCQECGSIAPCWRMIDDLADWGDLGEGTRWHCDNCDAWLVIRPFDPSVETTLPADVWVTAVDLLKRSFEELVPDNNADLYNEVTQFLTMIETEESRHG